MTHNNPAEKSKSTQSYNNSCKPPCRRVRIIRNHQASSVMDQNVGRRENTIVSESTWVVIPLDVSAAEFIYPRASRMPVCIPKHRAQLDARLDKHLLLLKTKSASASDMSLLNLPSSSSWGTRKQALIKYTFQAPPAISATFALWAAGDWIHPRGGMDTKCRKISSVREHRQLRFKYWALRQQHGSLWPALL